MDEEIFDAVLSGLQPMKGKADKHGYKWNDYHWTQEMRDAVPAVCDLLTAERAVQMEF